MHCVEVEGIAYWCLQTVRKRLNPADIATQRLSAARLESLCFFLGIWRGNNLEGVHDPGNIFMHLSNQRQQGQNHFQVNLLINALSLLKEILRRTVTLMMNHRNAHHGPRRG